MSAYVEDPEGVAVLVAAEGQTGYGRQPRRRRAELRERQ
jgi:hypothetical protein